MKTKTNLKVKMSKRINPAGTCYQGEVDIAYADLIGIFGVPNYSDHCNKTDAEWVGRIEDTVFTIYNYKDGKRYLGEKGKAVEDITDWHIGAKKKATAEKVLFFILKHTLKRGRS